MIVVKLECNKPGVIHDYVVTNRSSKSIHDSAIWQALRIAVRFYGQHHAMLQIYQDANRSPLFVLKHSLGFFLANRDFVGYRA